MIRITAIICKISFCTSLPLCCYRMDRSMVFIVSMMTWMRFRPLILLQLTTKSLYQRQQKLSHYRTLQIQQYLNVRIRQYRQRLKATMYKSVPRVKAKHNLVTFSLVNAQTHYLPLPLALCVVCCRSWVLKRCTNRTNCNVYFMSMASR